MLEVNKLYFAYKNKEILHNINFKLEPGINVLLGLNGVGKSTLFKCIFQELSYKGEIKFNNENLKQFSVKKLASKIAYIPQKTTIYFDFSVKDIISFSAFAKGAYFHKLNKNDEENIKENAKLMNIEHLLEQNYNKLSGGQQQLVLITAALAKNCELLIFDEPSAHLDLAKEYKLIKIFEKLASMGKCIFFSTHNILNTINYNTIILHDKQILAQGKNILNDELLSKVYGINLRLIDNKYIKFIED